jgi:hypothetical protein
VCVCVSGGGWVGGWGGGGLQGSGRREGTEGEKVCLDIRVICAS